MLSPQGNIITSSTTNWIFIVYSSCMFPFFNVHFVVVLYHIDTILYLWWMFRLINALKSITIMFLEWKISFILIVNVHMLINDRFIFLALQTFYKLIYHSLNICESFEFLFGQIRNYVYQRILLGSNLDRCNHDTRRKRRYKLWNFVSNHI